MNRIKNRIVLILSAVLFLLILTSCGQEEEASGNTILIYSLNHSETGLVTREYELQASQDSRDRQVDELLEQMAIIPEKLEYKPAIGGNVKIRNHYVGKDKATIDFEDRYRELSPTTEILVRAAFVRTLTQLSGLNYVAFLIEGEAMVDNLGNVVGVMSADQFVDNEGDEINSYELADLHLYFADETGTKLQVVNRSIRYSTNISMEKLVVEQLIQGPAQDDFFPTINPDTRVVNVTVKDGICYVNLSENFLVQTYSVMPEITIYSLVNSLVELPNINKVQISINGETDITFQESVSLNTAFERNLELLYSESEE